MNIDQINKLLKDQNYILHEQFGELHIKNKSMMTGCIAIISILAGVFVLLFLIKVEPILILLGITLIAAPFIYVRWRYPKTTIIDNNKKQLVNLRQFSFPERFDLEELNEIKLETSKRSSHTSAFEEGNEDFDYYFHITLNNEAHRIKLMALRYRKSCNAEMMQIAEYLNIRIKK